ncbi:MAG: DUF5615 family PIN-like protein [Candidatus Promineofilum sp.]|nr:DUF5615 family PIN-like protein [Promineifilum sp.]
MSRIRFYVDEHIARAVVNGLRRRDIDVVMPGDVNRRGYPDDEQLAFATAEGRVIVTKDHDYLRLHATGVAHMGIAFVSADATIGGIIRGLTLLYQVLEAEGMRDHVEFL